MLDRLDHVDLRVPSLSESESFFHALGLRVVRRHEERRSVEMSLPGDAQVFLEIREDPAVTATVVDHIAFRTSASAVDELAASGVSFTRTHHLVPATGRVVSNLIDPAGGKWQLAEEN